MAGRSSSIATALNRALAAAQLEPTDQAAAAMARQLAAICDASPGLLAEHSSKLLAVLVELKLTPRARAAVVKGGASDGPTDPRVASLHLLRAGQDDA